MAKMVITFINECKEVDEYECSEIEFEYEGVFADGKYIPCKNLVRIEAEDN